MDMSLSAVGLAVAASLRPGRTTEVDAEYAAAVARLKAAKQGAALPMAPTLRQAVVRFFGSEPRLQAA